MPEINNTERPAAATSKEVPRSGCFAINPTGIVIIKATITMLPIFGGNVLLARYHATTIGTDNFIISEG